MARPVVAFVSFRLGGSDGVSVEAAKWAGAMGTLGFDVRTIAGAGRADVLLPGLAIDAPQPPSDHEVSDALADAELVVVENLCSLPLNPEAAAVVSRVLHGRRAIFRHHDLPWQRERFAGWPPPPDDPTWTHVVINELSRAQLARHGIAATVVRNAFDTEAPPGDRERTRAALALDGGAPLVLQPTRAIPRKNVAGALALAGALDATFWLLGPAEDGYGPELDALVSSAAVRVVQGHGEGGAGSVIADAYAASDVVVLPSTWEGFGNPVVESAVHRRPLAIGPYPVGRELRAFGFEWFDHDDAAAVARFLAAPRVTVLDHNQRVARLHFSLRDLPARLESVLDSAATRPLAR